MPTFDDTIEAAKHMAGQLDNHAEAICAMRGKLDAQHVMLCALLGAVGTMQPTLANRINQIMAEASDKFLVSSQASADEASKLRLASAAKEISTFLPVKRVRDLPTLTVIDGGKSGD